MHLRRPLSERFSIARARFFVGLSIFFVIVFWETELVYPTKMLVVFLHEISHGLMALLTGGKIIRLEIDASQGGSTVTVGGSAFWIISAGYLGSIMWGGIILLGATRTDLDRLITLIFSCGLAAMTFFYVENDFGAKFGYLAVVIGMIAALKLPEIVCEAILVHIGTTSCIYAVLDIVEDLFSQSEAVVNDASLLANLTSVPTIVWAVVWLALSIFSTAFFLKGALTGYWASSESDDDDGGDDDEDDESYDNEDDEDDEEDLEEASG